VRKSREKRPLVHLEELEARLTPDVTLGQSAPALIAPPEQGSSLSSVSFDLPNPIDANGSLAGAPAGVGDLAQDASYLQAVGSIFSDSDELDKIFHSAAQPLLAQAKGTSSDGADAVWRFISNYCKKAIHNDELKYGSLVDHEDLVHQVYVEWREQVGNDSASLANLTNKDSTERQVLRKTVRRVLDHARYESSKQRRMVEFSDQPAPVNSADQDWIELQLDWSSGRLQLGPREKQMLQMRREGKTFEEIGAEMGLIKQRVSEMYNAALSSLQQVYAN
jgi:hypothetical protein